MCTAFAETHSSLDCHIRIWGDGRTINVRSVCVYPVTCVLLLRRNMSLSQKHGNAGGYTLHAKRDTDWTENTKERISDRFIRPGQCALYLITASCFSFFPLSLFRGLTFGLKDTGQKCTRTCLPQNNTHLHLNRKSV